MSPAWKYMCFALLFPYLVSFEPEDTTKKSYTDMAFGIGGGQYRYSDCSGSSIQRFAEPGVSITHKAKGPFRTGLALGLAPSKGTPGVPVLYPDLALDFNYFSLGTTGIRLGRADQVYLSVGGLGHVPLFTGRGLFSYGVGVNFSESPISHLWIGTNKVPFERRGYAIQPEFRLSKTTFLFVTGRYGTAYGMPEYGVSVGMRVRRF